MKFVKTRGRHLRLDEMSLILYTLYEYVGVYDSSNDLQRRLKYLALGIQLFSREKLTAYQFVDFHNRKQVRLKRIISILDAFFIIAGLALFIVFKRYLASVVVCLPPLAIRYYFYNRSVRNNFLHTSKVLENPKFTDFLKKVAINDEASFKLLEEKLLDGEFQEHNELSIERNANIDGQELDVQNRTQAVAICIEIPENTVENGVPSGAAEIAVVDGNEIEKVNKGLKIASADDLQLIAVEQGILEDKSEHAAETVINILNTQTAHSTEIEELTETLEIGNKDLELDMLTSVAKIETPDRTYDGEVLEIGADNDIQEVISEEAASKDNYVDETIQLRAFQEQLTEIAKQKNQFDGVPMPVVIDFFAMMCCPACKKKIPQMSQKDFIKFLNAAFLGHPLEKKIKLDRYVKGITREVFHQFMTKAVDEYFEPSDRGREKYSTLLSNHFEGYPFEKVLNNFRTIKNDRVASIRNQYKAELQRLQRLQS
ncbi:hypothetical protein [Dyadobacter bucti]|jgi:hypothetical protein|uniref:hypothetical protein n=1 Tax=Dyadobacter bucti TaxID=2572203 RepID=UPI003F730BCA